jgi:hypothetical protein
MNANIPRSLADQWARRWERREGALRNLIAHWRSAPAERQLLPSTARDSERARCATDLERALALDEPPSVESRRGARV